MQDPSFKSRSYASRGDLEGRNSKTSSKPTFGLDDGEHDRALVRWSLSLQPEERLAVLQDFVDTFWTPRHG